MQSKLKKIALKDRLDREYLLEGSCGQPFSEFLLKNYIPQSSIILKVNGEIADDQTYIINDRDEIDLKMVRAYQLPEYCQMLDIWKQTQSNKKDSIYTNKFLWFNDSGICDLKQANIPKEKYVAWLEDRFVESIKMVNLIQDGDPLCLPVSGGRDSLALLYLFERTKKRLPKFNFTCVTVSPTVAGVGDLKIATDAIESLGVKEYVILDGDYVKETMNLTSDFFAVMQQALEKEGRGVTISLWHIIMKACIEKFCRKNALQKIAYGYQFEDLLSSLLRSNLLGVSFGDSMYQKKWGDFNLIFPLWAISKKELTIYLELVAPKHQTVQSNPTRYDRGDHNRDIHYFLADMMSTLYPGIGFSLFSAQQAFNQRYGIDSNNFYSCSNCQTIFTDFNEDSLLSEDLCFACNYFSNVGSLNVCV